MKKALATIVAAAALVATSSVGAMAASQAPQNYGTVSNLDKLIGHLKISGSFSDQYNFSLAGPIAFSLSASVTANANSAMSYIQNYAATLYEFIGGKFTAIDTATPIAKAITGDTLAIADTLDVGSYRLVVSGKAFGPQVSYGGPLSVAAVPLPNSVALFGLGLAGLGVAGAVRRKAKRTSAAVA